MGMYIIQMRNPCFSIFRTAKLETCSLHLPIEHLGKQHDRSHAKLTLWQLLETQNESPSKQCCFSPHIWSQSQALIRPQSSRVEESALSLPTASWELNNPTSHICQWPGAMSTTLTALPTAATPEAGLKGKMEAWWAASQMQQLSGSSESHNFDQRAWSWQTQKHSCILHFWLPWLQFNLYNASSNHSWSWWLLIHICFLVLCLYILFPQHSKKLCPSLEYLHSIIIIQGKILLLFLANRPKKLNPHQQGEQNALNTRSLLL